ncbi:MAG: hydantoinase/oxoprolinase family protein [Syntrophomonas sp.]|nr:hydantoinase/oxoprolinase family protein [Syntrophomonas sp.]
MLIGIDVGGTFTDGVVLAGTQVVATAKQPTNNADLKGTIIEVLDRLLEGRDCRDVQRVVLSTTLVTNMLATGTGPATALLLMPGPGLPVDCYDLFPHTWFLKGSVDFRGRVIEPLDATEVEAAAAQIMAEGIEKAAIVSKFSNRNSQLERQVRDIVQHSQPSLELALGSDVAGQLNFRRRLVTTYYSVMTQAVWTGFVQEITAALVARGIKAEVDILKADGGTMPLTHSIFRPCETVFSGPAASTMGAVALTSHPRNSVIVDVGGTTSDISLLIDGEPLYASKGAQIQGHYTHIKAFSVRSLPLGGDSPISIHEGRLTVELTRRDNAACFGGPEPTVTDAFNQLYSLEIGQPERSRQALAKLEPQAGMGLDSLCREVVNLVISQLQAAITDMFQEWENEPAYRVWEVVHGRKFDFQEIVGIGAAAEAIIPVLAEKMQVACTIPAFAPVANALGACVARPTLTVKIHIDTQSGYWVMDQEGRRGEVKTGAKMQLGEALDLAQRNLQQLALERNMDAYADQAEVFLQEQFNVIRGWSTSGKIFDIGVQIAPGLIKEYQGVKQ